MNPKIPPKQRLQFNIALTYFHRLKKPKTKKVWNHTLKMFFPEKILEDEKELTQFYISLKDFPVKKSHVQSAFKDVEKMMIQTMAKLGMIK